MGLRIFLHSLRLVFGQFRQALRISAILYIVSTLISLVGFYFYFQAVAADGPKAVSWQFLAATFLSTLPYLWIAVAWHRFVLLDEIPHTPLPAPPGDRIWSYIGRGLQMGLLLFLLILAFSLVFTVAMVTSKGSPYLAIPLFIVVFAIGTLITYRLAPMLPGAAIGQSIGVGEAWKTTSGASGALLLLAVISAIGTFLIDLPYEFLLRLPGSPFTAMAWLAITSWVKLMVGVSILTTIYGIYVEKRSIT